VKSRAAVEVLNDLAKSVYCRRVRDGFRFGHTNRG
jgi:hypothetical protein